MAPGVFFHLDLSPEALCDLHVGARVGVGPGEHVVRIGGLASNVAAIVTAAEAEATAVAWAHLAVDLAARDRAAKAAA